jgi:hypothetical protein
MTANSQLKITFEDGHTFYLPLSKVDEESERQDYSPGFHYRYFYRITDAENLEFLRFLDYLKIDKNSFSGFYKKKPTITVLSNEIYSSYYLSTSSSKEFFPKEFQYFPSNLYI